MPRRAPEAADQDETWAVAAHRAEVIRRLLDGGSGRLKGEKVAAAASELGVSRAGLYRLVARYRALDVTYSLLPLRDGRPKGSRSLDGRRESIIAEEIDQFYLRPERPRLSDLCDRIGARCHEIGARPPNWRTVYARVRGFDAKLKARRRQDAAALSAFAIVPGELVAERPLDLVQIDHTEVDVIVVDPEHRQSVRRPWLTLAIDVHSRMVLGYHLSLNEPSVVSVGLCLLNAVFDKSALLADKDIDVAWPCAGLPGVLLVDNGPEFHSKAFLRGCQEHGIRVDWRPPRTPHYGGHIERLIGTQMGAVHVLPGSTGSSVSDKQGRDAAARATFTLRELERWLILEIAGKYHQKIHASLHRPPIAVWRELSGSVPLKLPADRLKFWVSFLPEERRQLRRDGIHLFGIRYWASALAQDVGRVSDRLTVRYDPRDLSRVFVRRPNGHFVEARYRSLGQPAIALWERNAAVRSLHEKGRREYNDDIIFKTVMAQRAIEDEALRKTMHARRNRERRPITPKDKSAEPSLHDIDMSAPPPGGREAESMWDES
jgi:putative transposase